MPQPYDQGREAFVDGKSMDDCPHPMGRKMNNARVEWHGGYLDEKYRPFHERLLDRYGIPV